MAKATAKPTAKAPKSTGDKPKQPTAKASPKAADDKPKRLLRRRTAKDSEQPRVHAVRLMSDPEATKQLADEAEKKAKGATGPLRDILGEVKALIRLVRAYASGTYRAVPFESMVIIVLALIYLVSPIDVIPDFLPGGLIDDAAVLAFALAQVREEVIDFMAWEVAQVGGDEPVAA
jgi:uncharacterized membrane protein YkvA (DUF1232 family)